MRKPDHFLLKFVICCLQSWYIVVDKKPFLVIAAISQIKLVMGSFTWYMARFVSNYAVHTKLVYLNEQNVSNYHALKDMFKDLSSRLRSRPCTWCSRPTPGPSILILSLRTTKGEVQEQLPAINDHHWLKCAFYNCLFVVNFVLDCCLCVWWWWFTQDFVCSCQIQKGSWNYYTVL